MWTWECYEHEQLNYMHMSVPEDSYQYYNALMSSVVSYEWLTYIAIQSAICRSHLKVSINTK